MYNQHLTESNLRAMLGKLWTAPPVNLPVGTWDSSCFRGSSVSIESLPLLQLFDLKTYDLRLVLLGREFPVPDIALVTIDDRTEQAIREPRIFWHPYYSALLRALSEAGARGIGVDVSFGMSVAKWEPDFDRGIDQDIR